MDALIILTGIVSVLAFVLNGAEKCRVNAGREHYPTALMALAGVIAPFGALMGMLLFGNRLKDRMMMILVPVMLLLFVLGVYLLRGSF